MPDGENEAKLYRRGSSTSFLRQTSSHLVLPYSELTPPLRARLNSTISRHSELIADSIVNNDFIGTGILSAPSNEAELDNEAVRREGYAEKALDGPLKFQGRISATTIVRQHSICSNKTVTTRSSQHHFVGILLALSSGISLVVYSVVAQLLIASGITITQLVCLRQALPAVFMVIWMCCRRTNPIELKLLRSNGFILVCRGLCGTTGTFALTYALTRLSVGDATALMYTSPLFVGILARIFLRERYKWAYFITAVFMLLGCVFIARPSALFGQQSLKKHSAVDDEGNKNAERLVGIASALGTAFLMASAVVLVRSLRHVPATITLFYYVMVGFIFGLVFAVASPNSSLVPNLLPSVPLWKIILGLLIYSASGATSQLLFAMALQYEDANIVSLLRTSDVLWAFAAQVIVFGVVPQLLTITGALLIIGSVIFLGMNKMVGGRKGNKMTKSAAYLVDDITEQRRELVSASATSDGKADVKAQVLLS